MKQKQLIIGAILLVFLGAALWFLLPEIGATVNVATLLKRKSSVSLSVLVLLLVWETLAPCFPFFFRRWRERGLHAGRNFGVGTLNSVVVSTFIATVWLWVSGWTAEHQFGLFHWGKLPGWMNLLGAMVLLDGWMYKWHWLNHRWRFLWRFHRLHHSDACMDVTTASRFHLGEILFSSLLRVPLLVLSGIQLWQVVLYEAVLFAVVQFQHANIALPRWLDDSLRVFIVTPAMHRIHHSRVQSETDSNYASLFSFWDRVFGTFAWREDQSAIQLGLDGFDQPVQQSWMGMLKTPLDQRQPPDCASKTHS